ncbi:hypothetical protein [uncultured Ilyobacter sp.]|uniref:hypothetical protein n=1 Tax=uncultured Ilyobacter sp. TaxID=544433 RepID=UPI0029F52A61|nr:hypothetical protein [uncultured Ilyobacter sp.]
MKKKGSAIVLAVLLLSFFTAIALAVFYLGGKKGERAYLKVIGEEVSNDVDMGSSLAYYDAYISEQFVRKGKVYDYTLHEKADDRDVYPAVSSMAVSTMSSVDTINYVSGDSAPSSPYYYLGIRLSSYINYFASSWDYTQGEEYKPYIAIDTFNKTDASNPILAYRNWQEDEDKVNRLWIYDGKWDDEKKEAMTVGGYRLEKLEIAKDEDGDGVQDSGEDLVEIYPDSDGDGLDDGSKVKDILSATVSSGYDSSWFIRATYVKRIRLDGGSDIGTADFKMQAVHKATIKFNDSDGDTNPDFEGLYADSGEAIEELIIERM